MKSKGNHWEASRPKYCFWFRIAGGTARGSSGDLRASFRFSDFFPDHYYKRVVMHVHESYQRDTSRQLLDW